MARGAALGGRRARGARRAARRRRRRQAVDAGRERRGAGGGRRRAGAGVAGRHAAPRAGRAARDAPRGRRRRLHAGVRQPDLRPRPRRRRRPGAWPRRWSRCPSAPASRSGSRPTSPGHCCARPVELEGLRATGQAAMARHTLEAMWRWSDGGELPIVTDASSCALGLGQEMAETLEGEPAERHAKLEILDSIAWAHDRLLPNLEVSRKLGSAAVHPTCSARHLGLSIKLGAIAAEIADDVTIPPSATCCGMAGDRGLLHPELPRRGDAPTPRTSSATPASTPTCARTAPARSGSSRAPDAPTSRSCSRWKRRRGRASLDKPGHAGCRFEPRAPALDVSAVSSRTATATASATRPRTDRGLPAPDGDDHQWPQGQDQEEAVTLEFASDARAPRSSAPRRRRVPPAPRRYAEVKKGEHTFSVRPDAAGNTAPATTGRSRRKEVGPDPYDRGIDACGRPGRACTPAGTADGPAALISPPGGDGGARLGDLSGPERQDLLRGLLRRLLGHSTSTPSTPTGPGSTTSPTSSRRRRGRPDIAFDPSVTQDGTRMVFSVDTPGRRRSCGR